jgi:CMP-N-acetylneuraminic acid synthetase
MRIKEKGKPDTKKKDVHFQRNGAVFIIPRANIDKGIILDGDEYEIEMLKSRSTDIDTEDDFKEAEAMMEYLLRRGEK